MSSLPLARRVVLAVLDGVRPDALARLGDSHWSRLARQGLATMEATTVSPSVTAAAMSSLLTGASPAVHGLQSDRFHIPRPRGRVDPMPQVLRRHALPTSAFLTRVPFLFRGLSKRIAARIGVSSPSFSGRTADDVLVAARWALREQRSGLVFMHWPDADRAGHARGWMSDEYLAAVHSLDLALGRLAAAIGAPENQDTLLIALADHGGGGIDPRNHDSIHPLDRTIPILLAGSGLAAGSLRPGASLLDVPPTVLTALGVPVPTCYAGRSLVERDAATLNVA